MRRINTVILNPLFLSIFVGALLLAVATTIATSASDDRTALAWIIAGTVLYLVVFVVTRAINVPLNDQLENATTLSDDAARADFESTWNAWNVVRSIASAGAFAASSQRPPTIESDQLDDVPPGAKTQC
jgi:uncharacterized membrane protein